MQRKTVLVPVFILKLTPFRITRKLVNHPAGKASGQFHAKLQIWPGGTIRCTTCSTYRRPLNFKKVYQRTFLIDDLVCLNYSCLKQYTHVRSQRPQFTALCCIFKTLTSTLTADVLNPGTETRRIARLRRAKSTTLPSFSNCLKNHVSISISTNYFLFKMLPKWVKKKHKALNALFHVVWLNLSDSAHPFEVQHCL